MEISNDGEFSFSAYTEIWDEEGFLNRLLLDLPRSECTDNCLRETQQHTYDMI